MLVLPLALGLVQAATASNSVPVTRAGRSNATIDVDRLKPSSCAGIVLTAIVTGSKKKVTGGSANELLLGDRTDEKVDGSGGNDCLVAGGGDDELDGGSGTDVCIGGPGTDTFMACETVIQ